MLIIKIHGSSVDTFTIGQGKGGDKFVSSGPEDIQWDDAVNIWRLSRLQVGAGSTTEAPFKLTSGSLTTVPDDGAMEYDGSHLYFTVGASRFQIDQQGSAPNSFVQNGNAFGALATLGTTDNNDLRFIVNNVERTRLLTGGNFIIAGTSVLAGEILRVNQLAQDPSGNTYGVYFDANFVATSVDFNQHTGFTLVTQASGNSNHTAVSGFVSRTSNSSSAKTTTLNGISAIVGNSSTGRTTNLTCITAEVDSPGTGIVDTLVAIDVSAIDISTANAVYGLRVADLNQAGADSKYGVYVGDISNAITTAYAIYSSGGQSYHAGNFGFGVTVPTARIHAAAGTATAGTAPIKLTSGTALGTAEDGAFEYHSSHLYFTIGSTRFQLDQQGPTGSAFVQNGNAFGALATLGTTDGYDLRFITNNAEVVRISSTGGYVGIGTSDFDGTPAVGKLIVKGSTNDASTNILVLRDSDEANVLTVDTDGKIRAIYASSYSLFGDTTSVGTYNTADCLVAVRSVTGTNGARAFAGSAESSSVSATTTASMQGINGFCRVTTASTANFTTTGSGGALRNRYYIFHQGTGTVSKASAISVGHAVGDTATGNSGVITEAVGINVETPGFQATAAIGTFYGLFVQGGAATITNRYGLYLENMVGGTNRWGVYQVGATDSNYFAGFVGIGATSAAASEALRVTKSFTNPAASVLSAYFDCSVTVSVADSYNHGCKASGLVLNGTQNFTGNIANQLTTTYSGSTATVSLVQNYRSVVGCSNSGGITSAIGYHAESYSAGAGTVSVMEGFRASVDGALATSYIGFRVNTMSTTRVGSTKYGIYIDSISGGSTNWAIYSNATCNSYMAGSLTLGVGAPTGSTLLLSKSVAGTADYYSLFQAETINSTVTTAYRGFVSQPYTAVASFTLPNIYHFQAMQGTFGAGSSVTTQTGFHAHGAMIGATNNMGFRGDLAAASGRWNLYMAGTAQNWIASNTGIGPAVSTPTAYLHLGAGTSAASTAPLKFTAGTNLGTIEAGAMEFDGTNLYFSPSTTRYTVMFNPMTTQYDLIIGGAAGVANRIAKGANNTVLGVNGSGVVTYLNSLPATLLDINGATEFTGTPDGANDSLVFYNSAAGGNRKILLNTLAKKKRTIALSAQGAILPVTSPATEVTAELATNKRSYRALEFSASVTNGAEWLITMPPEYDGGTVTILVQWLSTTAGAATNNGVRWSVAAIASNDSDAFDAAWGTAVAFTDTYDAAHVANDLRISSESSAITIAGSPAGGSLVSIRLQRLGADAADTFAGTARLLKMVMKYGENKWSA